MEEFVAESVGEGGDAREPERLVRLDEGRLDAKRSPALASEVRLRHSLPSTRDGRAGWPRVAITSSLRISRHARRRDESASCTARWRANSARCASVGWIAQSGGLSHGSSASRIRSSRGRWLESNSWDAIHTRRPRPKTPASA